tara:strand:- start:33 stop:428 length:396 start_codon:yes stop_codon:yes gene_type:complete
MAHFAELDVFCNVVRVIVVNDDDLKDSDNIEKEKIGQKFLNDMLGGTWVQTSFNTRANLHKEGGTPFRKNFASVGGKYDVTRDAFLPTSFSVYPSWTLNETTCQYDPPTPKPDDGKYYNWNEATTNWVEVV